MLSPKLKECCNCHISSVIWKTVKRDRYCKQCWFTLNPAKPIKVNPENKIPARSKLRIQEDRKYSILRLEFLGVNRTCQAGIPGCCSGESTDVHHKRGRGKWYLIPSTWLAVCRGCHHWIELNPKEAKELGFSESRLSEPETTQTNETHEPTD